MGGFCGSLSCPAGSPNFETIAGNQFVTVPYTPPLASCDFDGSGSCDGDDIDALVPNIAMGPADPATYDLTNDGMVNLADRDAWLAQAGAENLPSQSAYLLGDANLDGTVDGQDFISWNRTSSPPWPLGRRETLPRTELSMARTSSSGTRKISIGGWSSAVPEPATGIVGLLFGVLLSLRGLRK